MAAIPRPELHDRSVAACRLLAEQVEFARAEILMIFLSTPHEVDTTQLAIQAWTQMRRVLAPKVSWEQRRMIPIEIRSLDSDVRDSVLGMREPLEGMPIPIGDIDLVVVPGLGFDARGNRLGRGRGFYDRFLSHPDLRAVTCGLALEEQFVGSVPHDERDVKVDMLVTDQRVRRFRTRT